MGKRMKIMKLDYEMILKQEDIREQEDYGVITSSTHKSAVSRLLGREVESLYIMQDDCCYPILMAEWKWSIHEDDAFVLLELLCSDEEIAMLREIKIL